MTTENKPCLRCGAKIPPMRSIVSYRKRKYCSRRCYAHSITNEAQKDHSEKTCLGCSKPLIRRPTARIKRWNRRRFCNNKCAFGSLSWTWRGGRHTGISHGAPRVRICIWKGERMVEHRIVVEKALGRKLKSNEIVHHINSDSTDNRNTNLLVCDRSYHKWIHGEMSRRYAQEHFDTVPVSNGSIAN